MNIETVYLKNEEKAIFALRTLYRRYGYRPYKMGKFEEYDLYVNNKNFLVSDHVITFTDMNGRLMALKPDVTLSIIKNTKDTSGIRKLYYNENVYRVSKGTQSFKEIMQTGLECMGDIDAYTVCEVLKLAAMSLSAISDDFVLDVSHLGILSSVIDAMHPSDVIRRRLFACVEEKNVSEITAICKREALNGDMLKQLVSSSGTLDEMEALIDALPCRSEVSALKQAVAALERDGYCGKIHIDFSVIHDISYYNGIVFKGFVKGIASGILSGGQYDKLMKKMNRRNRAIGFAVYLDMLEHFYRETGSYDVDTALLYDDTFSVEEINRFAETLTKEEKSVFVARALPEGLRAREVITLCEGKEVKHRA